MAEFEYFAIDSKGRTKSGRISGDSIKAVRKELLSEGLTVLKVKIPSGNITQQNRGSKLAEKEIKKSPKARSLHRRTSAKGEKVGTEFLKRLLELHGSGMPVAEAVKLLNQRLSDPEQREIASVLWRELAEGRTLSRAMRLLPGYFGESTTYIIEAGEATGNLSPILKKIISHLEEKREIRNKVISGMSYPIFVVLVALGVVLFFLFFLLPQIEEMLDSLGGELNLMAKILIQGSNLIITTGPFVVIGLLVAFGITNRWSKTESGGKKLDQSMLKLPLFGEIFFLSELFQLSSLLATLMWSGIGLTENLRLCEKTIRNRFLRSQFRLARGLVNEGRSLPEVLRKYKLMPLMQLDVLEVGEKTGNLGNSMEDAALTFRDGLTKRIKIMTSLVSGVALGFAFSLVAIIAISIVTSIFQVSKSISY
jgi:type II secretory pathway component PulF